MLEKPSGTTPPSSSLIDLHANAVRLAKIGSPAQRISTGELLPAIEAELATRRAAKLERLAVGRRRRARQRAARNSVPNLLSEGPMV